MLMTIKPPLSCISRVSKAKFKWALPGQTFETTVEAALTGRGGPVEAVETVEAALTGVKTSFHLIHSRPVNMADADPAPEVNPIDMAVSTPGKDASDPDMTTARKALFQSTPKASDKTEIVSTPSTQARSVTLARTTS